MTTQIKMGSLDQSLKSGMRLCKKMHRIPFVVMKICSRNVLKAKKNSKGIDRLIMDELNLKMPLKTTPIQLDSNCKFYDMTRCDDEDAISADEVAKSTSAHQLLTDNICENSGTKDTTINRIIEI